jgi:hypothetical protein
MKDNFLAKSVLSISVVILFVSIIAMAIVNVPSSEEPTYYYDFCYQESVNVSSGSDGSCSQNYNGAYAFTGAWGNTANLIDGNWSSSSSNGNLGDAYFYMNYTKPSDANASSLWQVKDGSAPPQTVNLSISCWNQDPLQLRAVSHLDVNPLLTGSSWQCWNGASWSTLRLRIGLNNLIYEDAMWWYVPFEITSSSENIRNNSLISLDNFMTFMPIMILFTVLIFILGFVKFRDNSVI